MINKGRHNGLFDLVIFDMDGTLIDSPIDFQEIRKKLKIPANSGILEHISMLSFEEKSEKMFKLVQFELNAVDNARLISGAADIIHAIHRSGTACALLTRNSSECLHRVLDKFNILKFNCVKSRDNLPPKPHPDSVGNICKELNINPERTICIGDFYYDIQSAKQAGTFSVLFAPGMVPDYAELADWVIRDLRELNAILELRNHSKRSV